MQQLEIRTRDLQTRIYFNFRQYMAICTKQLFPFNPFKGEGTL